MITKILSELSIKISSGLTPLRSNPIFWENGTIPWLKTEQLGEKYIYDTNEHISSLALEKTNIRIFPVNSLSIAMYGEGKTRGNLSILKTEMTTNQACCNVELDPEKADYEYVYYFLKTQYEVLRNLSSGVRKNLNSNDIKNFPIRLPLKIKEQQDIARILKVLDDKIELNSHINSELEAMTRTLYDYWFVQFDFPDANGKPYKSSGGKMVYNPLLKREIPEGWKVKSLGDYANVKKGTLITEKEANQNGNIKVVSAGQNYSYFHDEANYQENVITISASGASAGFINFWREPIFACDCTTVQGSSNEKTIYILHFLLMRQGFIYQQARGSAQPHVYPKDISVLNIEVPPEALLVKFGTNVLAGNTEITNRLQQNQKLAVLRDWLLPMLMNGQVTIK